MKLGIFCNYSWPHVGGSEFVIKNISDLLVREYGYVVNVFGCNLKSHFKENGVNYFPCHKQPKGQVLFQAMHHDHIFVYSDSFWEFDTLVENIDIVKCGASVGLVGAYYMKSNPNIINLLKKSIEKINFITHSTVTSDYKFCIDNNLPVSVIPNGIFLEEFKENNINFREKYNIKNKYIILNISNFFYGKSQNTLPDIYDRLGGYLEDFIMIQISNSVQYPNDKIFLEQCKKKSHGANIRFLRDIPREDVVSAFKCADAFLLCSKKEVAPLVILESRAAKTPWVSLKVGNIEDQTGGIMIEHIEFDSKGYAIIDSQVIKDYVISILKLLKIDGYKEQIVNEGQKDIEEIDWKNIVPLYDKIFRE